MPYLIFYILTHISLGYLNAQYEILGSKQHAVGDVSLCFFDVFSANNNAAAMSFVKENSIGFSYQNKFVISSFNSAAFTSLIKIKKFHSLGGNIQLKGYKKFNTIQLALSYAIKIRNVFSIGASFRYHYLSIYQHGARSYFSTDISILCIPIKELRFSFQGNNIIPQKIEESYKERSPTSFALGMLYLPSKKVQIGLEFYKDLHNPIVIRLGMLYSLHKYVSMRLGFKLLQPTLCAGIGTHIKSLFIEVGTQVNFALNISPSISMHYVFNRKK